MNAGRTGAPLPAASLGATTRAGSANAALQARDRRVLWHPFTQQQGWMAEDFPVITAAEGNWLIDADGRRYLDAVSSLWCALHGHRVPAIEAAIAGQLARVAHSTLLGLSCEPAVALAEDLLEVAPAGLARVFYSDSGSTAVEVALKMAFQAWRHREGPGTSRRSFLCLEGSYHGDTLGAVSVGGIDLFHGIFGPLLFDVLRAPVPRGASAEEREADVPRCLAAVDGLLASRGASLAALVMEPGVQGASGIRPYPAGFTRTLSERARAAGLLVIADEVATGFGRSGALFACEREGISPDLLCLAKAISGGALPLAATLATAAVHDAFLGAHEELKTFFHGHTYTGNALACAAGRASLALCRAPDFLPRAVALGEALEAGLRDGLAHQAHVLELRRYGTMLGIELVARRGGLDGHGRRAGVEPFPLARRTGHRVTLEARRRGVILRPLGDTVVLMPPHSLLEPEMDLLVDVTLAAIEAATTA